MAVRQYLRKASLIVGDGTEATDLSELRFAWAVTRGDTQTPNTADIRVWNVAPETAEGIAEESTRVVLQAGYEGNYGIIFDGQIKQVRRGRESQTDTYVDITAADGDSAYNFAVSAFNLTADQTAPKTQVERLLKDMARHGITQGYMPDELAGNALPRGKVVFGMCRDKMRDIAKVTSTNWSIQDGQLTMIPLTVYMPGEMPIISPETGLIGMPEQTQAGIRMRILLNPAIKIGQRIKLDQATVQQYRYSTGVNQQVQNENTASTSQINGDGEYYVMHVNSIGDTRGNDWYMDMVCLSVNADVTPNFKPTFPVGQEYVNSIKRFG